MLLGFGRAKLTSVQALYNKTYISDISLDAPAVVLTATKAYFIF
jgi:hypothetical protein